MKRSPLKRGSRLRPVRKSGRNERQALDKLCRAIVFARDDRCQRCGRRENGQWCHVHSRRYASARWRLENSVRLCAGCHLLWHHRPLEAAEWFKQTYPERWQRLMLWSSSPQKVDLKLERIYLEAEARKYGITVG